MKKIIIAFDGVHFSEGAIEFARRLNEAEPVLLTGIFLPQADISNLWSYADAGAVASLYIPLVEEADTEVIQKNITRFETFCRKNDIEYRVHKDLYDFVLPELKKESRFADLLILGSEVFYENGKATEPNEYLTSALHDVECPVLIVPEQVNFPDNNMLLYDGSKSSAYAIKQFSYLFPQFRANKTLLVYAGEKNEKEIPDEVLIEELAARHFPDLTLFKLEINPSKYFGTWSADRQNAILVSGSFGRSAFSQLFRKSFITEVLKYHRLPVFIAHR